MRVCVCNCGSHSSFTFSLSLSLFLFLSPHSSFLKLSNTSLHRSSPHRSRDTFLDIPDTDLPPRAGKKLREPHVNFISTWTRFSSSSSSSRSNSAVVSSSFTLRASSKSSQLVSPLVRLLISYEFPSSRCLGRWGWKGWTSCYDLLSGEETSRAWFCSSTKTSGSWIASCPIRDHRTNSSTSGLSRILWKYRGVSLRAIRFRRWYTAIVTNILSLRLVLVTTEIFN